MGSAILAPFRDSTTKCPIVPNVSLMSLMPLIAFCVVRRSNEVTGFLLPTCTSTPGLSSSFTRTLAPRWVMLCFALVWFQTKEEKLELNKPQVIARSRSRPASGSTLAGCFVHFVRRYLCMIRTFLSLFWKKSQGNQLFIFEFWRGFPNGFYCSQYQYQYLSNIRM